MKVLSIARVSLLRFLRDRSTIFFVFVLPLGIVLLIGAQFSGASTPILGVLESEGEMAGDLIARLETDETVQVKLFDDEDDMLLDVERGNLSAGVVIPADLDNAVASGGSAEIGFMTRSDGFGRQLEVVLAEAVAGASEQLMATRFAEAQGAELGAAAAAAAQAADQVADLDVTTTVAGESLFGGNIGQFDIGATGQLVLFMFLTGLSGSAVIIENRQLGMTSRMAGTPTSVRTIVLGEALGRFAIVLTQGLYIVLATALLFGVDWGDPLGAAAVLIAFSAVGAGAAMMFGAFFKNDQQAGSVAIVAAIGLAAVGGSMMPLELFSGVMKTASRFTPHAWANEAFAELLRHDATVTDISQQLGVLTAIAVGLLAVASWKMHRVITRT